MTIQLNARRRPDRDRDATGCGPKHQRIRGDAGDHSLVHDELRASHSAQIDSWTVTVMKRARCVPWLHSAERCGYVIQKHFRARADRDRDRVPVEQTKHDVTRRHPLHDPTVKNGRAARAC
jgi:hypothetical protein